MSREVMIMDRNVWESMRNVDKKISIKKRYAYLEELINDDLEVDLY